jgi:hypothetical protein
MFTSSCPRKERPSPTRCVALTVWCLGVVAEKLVIARHMRDFVPRKQQSLKDYVEQLARQTEA